MRGLLKRTIAEFLVFVISIAAIGVLFFGCSNSVRIDRAATVGSSYKSPQKVGTITADDITESSGITASKCSPDVFWTHNDSGDGAFVFAINGKGELLGKWEVAGATNRDWEDIAEFKDARGKCYLYIGEIGDNGSQRPELAIYRVAEPTLSVNSNSETLETAQADKITFRYPNGPHDAETLLVHPPSGEIYVLTKRVDGPAGVYRIRSAFGTDSPITAEKTGEVKVPAVPNGLLTGGDIAPDGKSVVLCDYTAAYEFSLPENLTDFQEIWKQEPETLDIGNRVVGEAVCYSSDGMSIFATSEKKNQPFIRITRRQR